MTFVGHVIVHPAEPVTVTLKLQFATFDEPLAVQVTTVVPSGKLEPEAGEQIAGPEQLLVAGEE